MRTGKRADRELAQQPRSIKLFADQEPRLQTLREITDTDVVDLIRQAIDSLLQANGVDDKRVAKWNATRADRVLVLPVKPLGPRTGAALSESSAEIVNLESHPKSGEWRQKREPESEKPTIRTIEVIFRKASGC